MLWEGAVGERGRLFAGLGDQSAHVTGRDMILLLGLDHLRGHRV